MELTISVLLLTIASALLVAKLLGMLRAHMLKWTIFNKLPGPTQTTYPIIGHALMLRGDSGQVYATLLKIIRENINGNGNEVGCMWFGTVPIVMVTGPRAAEVLLRSSEHMDKSFLYSFLHPWLGTGLLTSKGEKWKARRRLLTPSFHFSILSEFLKSMNDQAAIFTEKLSAHAEKGDSLNLFTPITLCALDIICETAMGKSVNAQDCSNSKYVKAVYRMTDLLQERQKSPWLWMDFAFNNSSYGKEFWKILNVLHEFTNSVIKDRMEERKTKAKAPKKRRLAFLDLLLDVSNDGAVLSIDDIREEVDTFMFEGHDTTAAGMSWAFHLIGSHPAVQMKIQNELDRVFSDHPNRPIIPDDLRKLEYLELVIKESLRLFPSVPIIGRSTTSDCNIGGYDIPAGTECLIFTQVINRHEDHWTDPNKFDPERFITDNSAGRHPYSYLPFSAGPRNCIGQKFALMEEKVVLAHALRKFKVTSCERTEDIRMMSDIILRPGDGINVKLSRR